MRPLRMLLSLSTSLVAVALLLYVALRSPQNEELERTSTASNKGSFKALFSFTSPGSLFPPSAIISLTDDNSTFFLARPAAFGPALPEDGLSSPLWTGSGFGDDTMTTGGELGCSDVPDGQHGNDGLLDMSDLSANNQKKERDLPKPQTKPGSDHADIQSIQESAEIAGKVVLLKRGGCGFLAKVLWAQRRGGIAVIVGDDVRGGPLVRMYATGDTSNVTIPSLFTSHTTAHLLSSLLPLDASSQTFAVIDDDKASTVGKELEQEGHGSTQDQESSRTYTKDVAESTTLLSSRKQQAPPVPIATHSDHEYRGWFHSLFFALGFRNGADIPLRADNRRLPTSGDHDWLQTSDGSDDQKALRVRPTAASPKSSRPSDSFVIGKQDWRDADLQSPPFLTHDGGVVASPTPGGTKMGDTIFSGSRGHVRTSMTDVEGDARWHKWSDLDNVSGPASPANARKRGITSITGANFRQVKTPSDFIGPHKGLWVTLTPTNMSTSPFFDTLLVLVVSPLVTLTVVYALLLLRSRIRRRRWRAPKSVVERLPVRTYQTISDSPSAATPGASSPSTPLLQHSPIQSTSSLSRPRSISEQDLPTTSSAVHQDVRNREEEKRESGLAAWKRRYGGRQRECVVCLEEYENGISQVMSLPCGHEFHADCITPWLVTRRRTCPICKGDVVRSLSQSYHDSLQSPSRSPPQMYENVDDVQIQAAETRNDSPSASQPVPISTSSPVAYSPLNDDLEAGWPNISYRQDTRETPERRGNELSSSLRELSSTVSTVIWRGINVVRHTTSLYRPPPPEDNDRDR